MGRYIYIHTYSHNDFHFMLHTHTQVLYYSIYIITNWFSVLFDIQLNGIIIQ